MDRNAFQWGDADSHILRGRPESAAIKTNTHRDEGVARMRLESGENGRCHCRIP